MYLKINWAQNKQKIVNRNILNFLLKKYLLLYKNRFLCTKDFACSSWVQIRIPNISFEQGYFLDQSTVLV